MSEGVGTPAGMLTCARWARDTHVQAKAATHEPSGPCVAAKQSLVGTVGFEPTSLAAEDFKSPAYANSATSPHMERYQKPGRLAPVATT